MAVLGLRFCVRAFSSCGKRGPLFITVRGPLTIAASLVVEHRLQTRRLSNCGSRAQPLRGTWDLPRPGLKPMSPALAGRFSTTAPPGKPLFSYLKIVQDNDLWEKGNKWSEPYDRPCSLPGECFQTAVQSSLSWGEKVCSLRRPRWLEFTGQSARE